MVIYSFFLEDSDRQAIVAELVYLAVDRGAGAGMLTAFGQGIDIIVQHDNHCRPCNGSDDTGYRSSDRMYLQEDVNRQNFRTNDERKPAGVLRRVADFYDPNRNFLSFEENLMEVDFFSVDEVGCVFFKQLYSGFGSHFSFKSKDNTIFLDGGYNGVVRAADEGICFHLTGGL